MPCSDWLKSTSRHLSNLIDLLASFAHTFSNMAIEAGRDFEFVLRELLCELEKKGLNFSLKQEQKTAVKELFEGRDVVAVLPTGFGKSPHLPVACVTSPKSKKSGCLCAGYMPTYQHNQ